MRARWETACPGAGRRAELVRLRKRATVDDRQLGPVGQRSRSGVRRRPVKATAASSARCALTACWPIPRYSPPILRLANQADNQMPPAHPEPDPGPPGRKGDPRNGVRKLLLMGTERLDTRGWDCLQAALEPYDEIAPTVGKPVRKSSPTSEPQIPIRPPTDWTTPFPGAKSPRCTESPAPSPDGVPKSKPVSRPAPAADALKQPTPKSKTSNVRPWASANSR